MQATQVKQVVKTELLNKNFNPSPVKQVKANAIKLAETQPVELSRTQSLNRFLEAFGDCV